MSDAATPLLPVKAVSLSNKVTEPPLYFKTTGRIVVADGGTIKAFNAGVYAASAVVSTFYGQKIPALNTVWSFPLPDGTDKGAFSGLSQIGDDFVCVSGKRFYRFDSTQGVDYGAKLVKTSLDLTDSSIYNPPVTADLLPPITVDNQIILVTRSGQLIALENGDEDVRLNINRGYGAVDTQPVVDKKGTSIFLVASNNLISLDLNSGDEKINKPLPTEWLYLGLVDDSKNTKPSYMFETGLANPKVAYQARASRIFRFGLTALSNLGLMGVNDGVWIPMLPDVKNALISDTRSLLFSATLSSWLPFNRQGDTFDDLVAFVNNEFVTVWQTNGVESGKITKSQTLAWRNVPEFDFVVTVNKNDRYTQKKDARLTPNNPSDHILELNDPWPYSTEIYFNRKDRLAASLKFNALPDDGAFITLLASDTAGQQQLFLVAMGSQIQLFTVSTNKGTPSSLQEYSDVIQIQDLTITAAPVQGPDGYVYVAGVDATKASWLVEYDFSGYLNPKE